MNSTPLSSRPAPRSANDVEDDSLWCDVAALVCAIGLSIVLCGVCWMLTPA